MFIVNLEKCVYMLSDVMLKKPGFFFFTYKHKGK